MCLKIIRKAMFSNIVWDHGYSVLTSHIGRMRTYCTYILCLLTSVLDEALCPHCSHANSSTYSRSVLDEAVYLQNMFFDECVGWLALFTWKLLSITSINLSFFTKKIGFFHPSGRASSVQESTSISLSLSTKKKWISPPQWQGFI